MGYGKLAAVKAGIRRKMQHQAINRRHFVLEYAQNIVYNVVEIMSV